MNTETIPTVEAVTLIQARDNALSPAELKTGKVSKKSYLAERIAAGQTKALALKEFETALAQHKAENKASLAAVLSVEGVEVTTLKTLKSGRVVASIIDGRAKREKEAEKAAARVAKLEAQLAAARAKLSAK